jgi:hypothetical protein
MTDSKGKYPYSGFNQKKYLPKYPGEVAEEGVMTSTRMYTSASLPSVNNDGLDTAGIGTAFADGDLWIYTGLNILFKCNSNEEYNALWEPLGNTQITYDIDVEEFDLGTSVQFYSVSYAPIGKVSLTLPYAVECIGRTITVSDSGCASGTNPITVWAKGEDKIINDETDQDRDVISNNGSVKRYLCLDATNWKVY